MSYKPKLIGRVGKGKDLNGYSKDTVRFENKCMKCEKIFIGLCGIGDRYEFRRICSKCKNKLEQGEESEETHNLSFNLTAN